MKKVKVLVLIDCQNDFITGALANVQAQEAVPRIVAKLETAEDTVVFATLDEHDADYLNTQEGVRLPVKHCQTDTWGARLQEQIDNALVGENFGFYQFVKKNTFGSMSLLEKIECVQKDYEIESIEFCGFVTDICVITNAMIVKTAFPEIRIVVDASCCAGCTPESHKNALAAMKMCQIDVINEEV
jgi:nicotinamidase/pyrazinamidase